MISVSLYCSRVQGTEFAHDCLLDAGINVESEIDPQRSGNNDEIEEHQPQDAAEPAFDRLAGRVPT